MKVVLDHSERRLTGLSHWHTMLFPKTNQSAVAARWALRILQAASILEAIGQHRLGLLVIHLGAAAPSMTPLMVHFPGDATKYRSALVANFNSASVDD
jgi:hypothetical protein